MNSLNRFAELHPRLAMAYMVGAGLVSVACIFTDGYLFGRLVGA
jgi:hypothetical protein